MPSNLKLFIYLRKLFSVASVASVAKYSSKILVSRAQICRPAGTFYICSFCRRVKNPSLVCIVPNGTFFIVCLPFRGAYAIIAMIVSP